MSKQIITICGSMYFFEEIKQLQKELESLGFIVFTPNGEGLDKDYSKMTIQKQIQIKNAFIQDHLEKIKQSDAILLANYTKNNQPNYIGANTFLELGFAFVLNKQIFILNDIPLEQNNSTEILGLKPIALKCDLKILYNKLKS